MTGVPPGHSSPIQAETAAPVSARAAFVVVVLEEDVG